jgi:hypothetical protein
MWHVCGEKRCVKVCGSGNLRETETCKNKGIDGRMILKQILKKQ